MSPGCAVLLDVAGIKTIGLVHTVDRAILRYRRAV